MNRHQRRRLRRKGFKRYLHERTGLEVFAKRASADEVKMFHSDGSVEYVDALKFNLQHEIQE